MAGLLDVADLKRAASVETVEELTARVATLEVAIEMLTARLNRLDAARKDQRQAEDKYEITSLIG